MDAFEQLAADLFWADGYCVRNSVKIELTRDEKCEIGRHSSPRWEIDLIAYRPATSELLALECKSYLDSGGVHAGHRSTPTAISSSDGSTPRIPPARSVAPAVR